jgi:putative membrane protein
MTMEQPAWVQKHCTQTEIDKIKAAVAAAETRTAGEIVPMVVSRSSHTAHVPLSAMTLLAVVFLSVALFLSRSEWFWVNDLWLVIGSVISLGLGWWIARFDQVQRWFVPLDDQLHQVERRAELEFYEAGLERTKGGTGILLFVSLLERRAVVLADIGISGKLPPETWDGIVKQLIDGIKEGSMGQGFATAIHSCADILEQHFPIQPDDTNELKNHLIIKD